MRRLHAYRLSETVIVCSIKFARSEQLQCAEWIQENGIGPFGGARLGLNDWMCEDILMSRLIGLSGRAGVGKDEIAKILGKLGYIRVAFADKLKEEVDGAVLTAYRPVELAPDIVEAMDRMRVGEVWEKPTKPHVRVVLQYWGTEYRRKYFGEDYWVEQVERIIRSEEFAYFVVSDVRFPNEVDMIRRLGGRVFKVERDVEEVGIPGHASEDVDKLYYDKMIINNGTIEDLRESVLNALEGD